MIEVDAGYVTMQIPSGIAKVLAFNRHLLPRFRAAIIKSVQASFEHPDTKMRAQTEKEVKFRVALCMEILSSAYHDHSLTLIHAMDILQKTLIDTLRMGAKPDMTDHGARWSVDTPLDAPQDGRVVDVENLDESAGANE